MYSKRNVPPKVQWIKWPLQNGRFNIKKIVTYQDGHVKTTTPAIYKDKTKDVAEDIIFKLERNIKPQ